MPSLPYRLLKGAQAEYLRAIQVLARRPFTTVVLENFVTEIEEAIETIARHPDRYPWEGVADYRRHGPTALFKFRIVYAVRDGEVVIIAIVHPSRRPRYWAGRRIA